MPPPHPSRRRFTRSLALSLGAATVAGPLSALRPRSARARARADSLGVALVGLGNYATNQLAPALQETEFCHLAGIVTGSPEKIPEWQARYDIPDANVYNYDTFDRIADNDAIDIVYVVLPNSMHAEYTIRAAAAGKHVLCEKPMATSVEDAVAMIRACRDAGKQLSVGYRLHFEPHNVEAMRLGQEQVFGPVKVVEAGFGFRIGNPNQWRLRQALAGGGALQDVGIYALQAARYVTGEEPVWIAAQETKTDPVKFAEVDESISWQMGFPSGALALCYASYNAGFNRYRAAATNGWFELEPAYSYGGIQGRTNQGAMDFPQVNQQARQMDAFATCILEDRPSEVSGEEGLRDVRLIQAIYASIADDSASL